MTVHEKTRWKNWAESLRQQMMGNLTPEITKSVDAIVSEVGTTKPENTLRSERFWRSCQTGKSPNDALTVAGFEIEFDGAGDQGVEQVTLKLNATWMAILQRVLDRQRT